ncbi:hypothetical protein [Bacillus tropicus]|uniref:hypothetical protein n=1 Tax=Bacillus tropicus TaxID=2026188 RepID=UPI001CFDFD4F|nr:hypothetical protein [Bacillus tropicus]
MNDKTEILIDKTYAVIQGAFFFISCAVILSIIFVDKYKEISVLSYMNLISLIGAVALLILMMRDKIDLFKDMSDYTKKKHKKRLGRVAAIYIISIVSIIIFMVLTNNLIIDPKIDAIIGAAALGIALSSDVLSIFLLHLVLRRSIKKHKNIFDIYDKAN